MLHCLPEFLKSNTLPDMKLNSSGSFLPLGRIYFKLWWRGEHSLVSFVKIQRLSPRSNDRIHWGNDSIYSSSPSTRCGALSGHSGFERYEWEDKPDLEHQVPARGTHWSFDGVKDPGCKTQPTFLILEGSFSEVVCTPSPVVIVERDLFDRWWIMGHVVSRHSEGEAQRRESQTWNEKCPMPVLPAPAFLWVGLFPKVKQSWPDVKIETFGCWNLDRGMKHWVSYTNFWSSNRFSFPIDGIQNERI